MLVFEVTYNVSVHSTTAHTPFFLNYVFHHKTVPAELMVPQSHTSVQELLSYVTKSSAMARENIVKKNAQTAKYANLKWIYHGFMDGDKVLLYTKSF